MPGLYTANLAMWCAFQWRECALEHGIVFCAGHSGGHSWLVVEVVGSNGTQELTTILATVDTGRQRRTGPRAAKWRGEEQVWHRVHVGDVYRAMVPGNAKAHGAGEVDGASAV